MKDAEQFLAELKRQSSKQEFDEAAWQAADPFDVPFGDELEIEIGESKEASLSAFKQEIENRAVALLARREHGDLELKTKLRQKFDSHVSKSAQELELPAWQLHELIDEVIAHCQQNNWQDNERYIEVAVNSLSQKGQGPLKIRQKLQQTCSSSELIAAYLDWGREDWAALAKEVLQKKYRATVPDSLQQRAKWTRFLQSRGFAYDQIQLAMR